MNVDAIKASVRVVNKRGGVLGHKIDVTYKDDTADPTTAITLLQSALSGPNPPTVYMNAGPSNLGAAVIPVANSAHILSFNEGPTATTYIAKDFPLNFDVVPSTANYAAAFCPYVKAHGGTSVGIIYGNDAYGDSLSALISSDCTADGVNVVGVQSFADTAIDATPQLLALQALKPSYLLFEGYGTVVGYVLQDINKIGWTVPILGDTAVAASASVIGEPVSAGGLLGTPDVANLKVLVFPSTVYSTNEPANLKTMIANINVYTHGQDPSSLIFGYQYDSIQLLAAAAKQANSIKPAAIAKALGHLKPGTYATGVFPTYYDTLSTHAPQEPPAAFTFASPSLLVNGQYDAPGSGSGG
jgi:branched-chain amino acid transport system substrate-binding protein